jgi:hypothetical protein
MSFVKKANMKLPRCNHSSINLDNREDYKFSIDGGRFLVVGGFADGGSINSCELYDSVENKWIVAPSLGNRKHGVSCCLMNPGNQKNG